MLGLLTPNHIVCSALAAKRYRLDLHTDWDDAAEHAWWLCRFNKTPEEVERIPWYIRSKMHWFAAEWEKYQRGH